MGLLSPTYYYRSVSDIDLDALRESGIDTLLVDIDNTILPRDTKRMPEELITWARRLSPQGFKVCLVSNNWHDHVKRTADALGLLMVPKALKPLPYGFRKAMRLLGSERASTAVIGDQVFTDVLGGNALGLVTVLVTPMSPVEPPHTLVLRAIERRLLAGRRPLP
jgi:HAD superfamily phosphatase (TIGR01668 family)